MTAILIIEAFAILLLGVLVVGLLRSHAEIIRTLHRLGAISEDGPGATETFARPRPRPVEGAAPDLVGQSLEGSTVHVGVSGTDRSTLLAFLSTGCTACLSLWEELRQSGPTTVVDDSTRLVIVTKGLEAESPSRLADLAPAGVPLVQSTEAWEAYGVPVTPYFVLVDATGEVIGEGSSGSWAQVKSLMGQAVADREAGPARDDEILADRELRRAGIGPGHPSLYPGDGDPGAGP